MRTISTAFALFALCAFGASQASARELDSRGEANTSLASAPSGSTSSSMRRALPRPLKKDMTVPTKYDSSYPVRDLSRTARIRHAI